MYTILEPSDIKLPFVYIWVTNTLSEHPVWCELPPSEVMVALLVLEVLTAGFILKGSPQNYETLRNPSELLVHI